MRVAFKSLGCRVNFEEIECLRGRFVDEGFRTVAFDDEADLYVINTCTVTGLADAESRKLIRRAVRRKPSDAIVAVTGCYAQRDPSALRALDGVDLVLGNVEKAELFEHVRNLRADHRLAGDLWVSSTPTTRRFLAHGSRAGQHTHGTIRTRATLKVQDGCDERCTYCIIPSVRGASVSRALPEVLSEARHLAACGFREIALTGVNTGCYGHDLDRCEGMAELVQALQELDLPVRFRLNSLEPATVTARLLDALAGAPSFAPHFHVPLQHGDSQILRRMGRTYDSAFYRDVACSIRARFPDAGIGADVMVGFPGETDAHFETSRAFVATLPLTYLHVFTYSKRSGTAAVRLPDHLPPAVQQERSRAMHDLETDLRTRFVATLAGTEQEVLVEAKRGPSGFRTGLTGNYLRVELTADEPDENEFWIVRIAAGATPKLARATPLDRGRPLETVPLRRARSASGFLRHHSSYTDSARAPPSPD